MNFYRTAFHGTEPHDGAVFRRFFLFMMLLMPVPEGWCRPWSFQPGEKVTYSAWYNWGFIWISAGRIDFEVAEGNRDGVPTYLLRGTGSTYPSYDRFFPVRDTLLSEVTQSSLEPFWACKHAHEGKWSGDDDFLFRPLYGPEMCEDSSVWEVETRLRRKGGLKPVVVDTTLNRGFDILTSVYRLRCIPDDSLLSAKPIVLPVRLDDGEYEVFLHYQGEETVRLHKGGAWDCYLFHLSLVEGTVFKKGDYMKIWLTKDNRRLPVQIEAPILVGSVKAIYENGARAAR